MLQRVMPAGAATYGHWLDNYCTASALGVNTPETWWTRGEGVITSASQPLSLQAQV